LEERRKGALDRCRHLFSSRVPGLEPKVGRGGFRSEKIVERSAG